MFLCVCVLVRQTDRLRAGTGSWEGGYFCRLESYPFIINMSHGGMFKTEEEQHQNAHAQTHIFNPDEAFVFCLTHVHLERADGSKHIT